MSASFALEYDMEVTVIDVNAMEVGALREVVRGLQLALQENPYYGLDQLREALGVPFVTGSVHDPYLPGSVGAGRAAMREQLVRLEAVVAGYGPPARRARRQQAE